MSVFQILGGLGVFLYGLRVMSGGLQRVAGARLRAILGGLTKNRFAGVVSGFSITSMVQSSSATTVLVVSFANAGLITLIQAIGLVMGANIGTTITGWLVALLGFKVKIAKFALPVIGIAFPLSFLKSRKAKDISDVFVGFGLLFLGLAFLKAGVPDLKKNPEALEFVRSFAEYGFFSILAFVAIGTIVTVIVQSSSATMAITLAMAAKGWIGYDVAAAMVLGENIGTTVTAQLAAIGATRNARRVAMSHTIFNLIGVLWMLPIMGLFLGAIDAIVPGDPWAVATGDDAGALAYAAAVTAHLAAFHTAFNIVNTGLMIGFVNHIARLVTRMIPLREGETEQAHFGFLDPRVLSTSELVAGNAKRGVREMLRVCQAMGQKLHDAVSKPSVAEEEIQAVEELEEKLDEMEAEIIEFANALARSQLSAEMAEDASRYVQMADDVECLGDRYTRMARLLQKQIDTGHKMPKQGKKALLRALDECQKLVDLLEEGMEPGAIADAEQAEELAQQIFKIRTTARKEASSLMRHGDLDVRDGVRYLDSLAILEELARIGRNVAAEAESLTPT